MGWLFGQTWIWLLIAFILGLLIGFLIAWFLRKKQLGVPEERIARPSADKPARERDLTDDLSAKTDADVDTPALAADTAETAAGDDADTGRIPVQSAETAAAGFTAWNRRR